ncbi:MFS transporter [Nocardioides guangzhouensis]|uniref:MFS transporter n=1 Tax=Nocardioides guangzhouensis TaxID=2497878 RepID=UPI001438571C|nr:MFS transporter [Nocardioides guangzhouensis]
MVEVGTALSIAAAVGLFAGLPLGHLADRRGPREVLVALLLAVTVLSALVLLVQEWWQFVVLASAIAIVDRGSGAVRQALVAGLVGREGRSGTKASLRSITNVGMAACSACSTRCVTCPSWR